MTGADDANLPYIVAISCMVALMLISMLIAIGIIKDKERFTKVVGGAVVILGGGSLVYVIGYTMAYVAMSTDYVNNDIEGFAECVAKEKVSDAPAPAPAEGEDAPKLSPKEECAQAQSTTRPPLLGLGTMIRKNYPVYRP